MLAHNANVCVCSAAARKAAKEGLVNPVFQKAPDPHGGPHPRPPIGALPPSHNGFENRTAAAERRMDFYGPRGAGATSPDGGVYQQTRPGRTESTFALGRGGQLGLPRGQFVIRRWPTFAEVKRVGPATDARAWSRSALARRVFQGRGKPLSFVHGRRNLALDKPGPNGRGVSLNRLRPPPSWGHSAFQRGLTGYVRQRGRDPTFTSKGMSRGPALSKPRRIRLPYPMSRAFSQSRGLMRHMTKPKIRSS